MPRVTAQWMVVSRHVDFRRANGQQDGTFELFRDNATNEIRAIRDEPEFAITLNPPLPTTAVHPLQQHPFQQHIKHDDPPVQFAVSFDEEAEDGGSWTAGPSECTQVSMSAFIVEMIIYHYYWSGPPVHTMRMDIDGSVRGGYLDGVLTQSPHTPLDGCSAVEGSEGGDGNVYQTHLLTAFNDPFIAWVRFRFRPDDRQNVRVTLVTTEQPVGSPGDPFPSRYQRAAALARRSLGPVAPVLLDGQAP
mmetsp:Transcript_33790/g.97432  ORF Transcript_33790/g.97432 Transcript_33790/m.97432 type:complete len:247 (-) Transcript_33790:1497-2237(-)